MSQRSDAEFWDQKYRHRQAPWDGEPNPLLAEVAEGLTPGAALDLGCGEGADALWLARRGWQVTAVDISGVALERARAADTDRQVTWQQTDMLAWQPPADAFDLVSAHFLHIPPAERTALFDCLARAVRPGGTLLVVAHHVSDLETTIGRPPLAELYYTADEVAASLTVGRWEVVFGGLRPRIAKDPQGRTVTIHDTVLQAQRIE